MEDSESSYYQIVNPQIPGWYFTTFDGSAISFYHFSSEPDNRHDYDASIEVDEGNIRVIQNDHYVGTWGECGDREPSVVIPTDIMTEFIRRITESNSSVVSN